MGEKGRSAPAPNCLLLRGGSPTPALDIPALVVPGHDASHATSAARYLEECLPRSGYWDVPVERQDEDATNARVLEFLAKIGA
jgi:hypothetical protein